MNSDIAGIILAGGLSRRMGGGDKPLRDLGGKPLVAHVIDRLRPQVAMLALNANGASAGFASYGLDVVPDTVEGFAGPLAGILAGMEWMAATGSGSALVSAAGDTPFFPRDLAARLAAAAKDQPGAIAMASCAGRRHPTFALWPLALRHSLRRFLVEEQGRRVLSFIERHPFTTVDFEPVTLAGGPRFDPFFNVNTPADLAEARLLAARIAS